jgi:short-subunit dehydrogenase
MICARKGEALEEFATELRLNGVAVEWMAMDTAEFDQVQAVAQRTMDIFGRIDTWVHNAGVGIWSRFIDMTPEEFARVIQVNLMGPVHGALAALPFMKREGGAFITVSSVESEVGMPFQSAYASSKHAVKGFLDVLRMELDHDMVPVSVTNIKPAYISTPFFTSAHNKIDVKPKAIPPIYPPERVAEAIVDASQHPRADVIVGGAGYAMVWGKRLMPGLVNKMLSRVGYEGQLSTEPRGEAGNLYDPVDDRRTRGDFAPTVG